MSDLEIFKAMLTRSGVGFREDRDADQVHLWFEPGEDNVVVPRGAAAVLSFDRTSEALACVEVVEEQ